MVTGAIPIVSTVIDCLKRTVYGEAAGYSERAIYFHIFQLTSRQLGAKLTPSSYFTELRAKLARSSLFFSGDLFAILQRGALSYMWQRKCVPI